MTSCLNSPSESPKEEGECVYDIIEEHINDRKPIGQHYAILTSIFLFFCFKPQIEFETN